MENDTYTPALLAKTDGAIRLTTTTKTATAEPELVTRLKALLPKKEEKQTKQEWSISKLAEKLGENHAYVSLYARQLNDEAPKFPGDLKRFEQKLKDFFRTQDEKRTTDESTFDTAVSRAVAKFISGVRAVSGIGVLHGEAGLGKSVSIQRYKADNPLALCLDVYSWTAGKDATIRGLFKKLETHGYSARKETKAEWLVNRLNGYGGCLVIDNAHKLTMGAFHFLFDLHDLTGLPMVLVGNPAIIDKLRSNDQLFSRVGMHTVVGYKPESLAKAVDNLLAREMPAHAAELRAMALRVAKERGHLRSLKHHLRVTSKWMEQPDMAAKGVVKVFAGAHEALITETYKLTDPVEIPQPQKTPAALAE